MRTLISIAAALLASTAQAEPLTYAAALQRAERTAPTLQASMLQAEAAKTAEGAAGQLPDPKLTFGIDNFPISGPNAGRFGADDMTMARIGIMQEVPNPGRRRAAAASARAETAMALADTDLQLRKLRASVALAWIDLAYAERRLAELDRLVDGLKELWEGQPASVASGSVRLAVGLEPTRLKAEFADRRSELVAEVAKARAELTRWTGDPDPTTAGPAPHLQLSPSALRAEVASHPALTVLAASTRRAEAEVAGARAAKRPDWAFEVMYGRRDPMFGDMVSVGATVSLPLFAKSRQDPLIAARAAQASRARLLEEEMRRELTAALEGALAEHVARHEQWTRAKEVLVPTAEQKAHLEIASYAAARADYADLVEAFTGLADAKLDTLLREAMVARDAARILLTYGSEQP